MKKLERCHSLRIGALIQAYDDAVARETTAVESKDWAARGGAIQDRIMATNGLKDALLNAMGSSIPVVSKGRYFMVVRFDDSKVDPTYMLVVDELTEV